MEKAPRKKNLFADLPLLAMEKLASKFTTAELLELSRCSKRCTAAVARARLPPMDMKIYIGNREASVKIEPENKAFAEKNSLKWELPVRRCDSEKEWIPHKNENGNCLEVAEFPVKKLNSQLFVTKLIDNRDIAIGQLIFHLFKIFPRTTTTELKIDLEKETKNFGIGNALSKVESVKELTFYGAHPPSWKYVHEHIKVTDLLFDYSYAQAPIHTRLVRNTPNYACGSGQWMSQETFLNLKCETIALARFTMAPATLNSFLLRWKKGEDDSMKKFRWWKMCDSDSEDLFDLKNLEGLNARKWDPAKRARGFEGEYRLCCQTLIFCRGSRRSCDHPMDCSKGFDIESDEGLLGTLFLKNGELIFYVWHERFPAEEPIYVDSDSDSDAGSD